MSELSEFKDRQRTMWAAGDYHAVAHYIRDVGPDIVARLDVTSDDDVLDVACGTGNAAIPAALTGARVVGADLTPELFAAARGAAAEAGVEIEWVQGDAEDLPFDDESFDVVISTFGCMFAPRHSAAAAELNRVLRPGGRLGLCNWRPDGTVGEFFATIGKYVPPSPLVDGPPSLWGTEEHIHTLFADSDISFEFEQTQVEVEFESAEVMMELYEEKFGPILAARAVLEPEGRWPELRADLLDFFGREIARHGLVPLEYLVVLGRKAG